MAAVAEADGQVASLADDDAGALVVEHVQLVARIERGLVHERPAELGLARLVQLADELVLDGHVAVEQLGQGLLVEVPVGAHHRELEEARHGRRQEVAPHAVETRVDEQRTRDQLVELALRLGRVGAPGPGGVGGLERGHRELGDQPCLALGEEHGEDVVEELRRRRPHGELVETAGELFVSLPVRCGAPRDPFAVDVKDTKRARRGPLGAARRPPAEGARPG